MSEARVEIKADQKGTLLEKIPVHISYEIIRLFSEGLYQSPHKAIEELVSNGYDAGASQVHVLLPDVDDDTDEPTGALWVIDDGEGMDAAGFNLLWRVAESTKAKIDPSEVERPPIGQFGIGKLAAYVLAWRLVHVSKAGGTIRITDMDFHEVSGRHQYQGPEPLQLGLYEVDEIAARELLAEVEHRDPAAWDLLFGDDAADTWTAAGLSDFKNLYDRLSTGTLGWVLRTGLPLTARFAIYLNGEELVSAKQSKRHIEEVVVGGPNDLAAEKLGIATDGGVEIDGISGAISGRAKVFEDRLTSGKAAQVGRSHGFFVKVRNRVINLEDELFGLDVLNHSAWSRFWMEIEADGLRDHLLSSREGVRDSEAIRSLRRYLHAVFNQCRRSFEEWERASLTGLDLDELLRDAPSLLVTEPLFDGVRRAIETGEEPFYMSRPHFEEDGESEKWLADYRAQLAARPFNEVKFEALGQYNRALRYLPERRELIINVEHPFIDKLFLAGRHKNRAATLFGSAEVITEALLQDYGVPSLVAAELLEARDRVLRVLAGDHPPSAREVLRQLQIANRDEDALERAVGLAFQVLGFHYEKRGGKAPGPDGVLFARLGRHGVGLADYRVVYDTKQTGAPRVSADKLDIESLNDFRDEERADFAFFVAVAYAAEDNPAGKLNKIVSKAESNPDRRITLLRIDHVTHLVKLHYQFGIPLDRLRDLFETASTTSQVDQWLSKLEREMRDLTPPVPLKRLLTRLHQATADPKAQPNVKSVRAVDEQLKAYSPEKLFSVLRGVQAIVGERWIEVEDATMDIKLHGTVERMWDELERNMQDLFGQQLNESHE